MKRRPVGMAVLAVCSAMAMNVQAAATTGMAAMQRQLLELQRKVSLLEDKKAIGELMVRYELVHNTDVWMTYQLFANRPDSRFSITFDNISGYDNIKPFFEKMRTEPRRREGTMYEHPLTTEYIEVAGDGQTAKGFWASPGHETIIRDGKPMATWCYGKYAVDFIKEAGQWKIWHVQWIRFFRTPYYKSWVDQTDQEIHDGFKVDQDGKPIVPDGVYFSPYTQDKLFKSIPAKPQPYQTWSENEERWWSRPMTAP